MRGFAGLRGILYPNRLPISESTSRKTLQARGDGETPIVGHRGSRSWYALARLVLVGSPAILAASESRAGGLIPIGFDPSRPLIVATDGSVAYDAPTCDF